MSLEDERWCHLVCFVETLRPNDDIVVPYRNPDALQKSHERTEVHRSYDLCIHLSIYFHVSIYLLR